MTDTLKRIDGHQDKCRGMTTTTSPYGTIDYYADIIRPSHHYSLATRESVLTSAVLGVIQSVVQPERPDSDSRRVELIRNLFAAEQLVRAELIEADRAALEEPDRAV